MLRRPYEHQCRRHFDYEKGSNKEFEVLRIGADFKIRCTKCGREVMVPRNKIEKNIKAVKNEKE